MSLSAATPAFRLAAGALLARRGEEIESEIAGDSMGPTLPPGTAIRVRCVQGADCRTGDIVTFVAGRALVTHRVVARGHRAARRGFLITRGDGTWLCDPPVAEDLVVGVVTAWKADGRWRPAAELRAPPPGTGARLFARALVLALDFHLRAAQGMHAVAYVTDRAVGRRLRTLA